MKTVHKWYKQFKSVNESIEDEQRSFDSKKDEILQKVAKQATIRQLTEELIISYGSV